MNTTRLFGWLTLHMRAIRIAMVPILLLLVAGVGLLVDLTGGVRFSYLHSMYLPVMLAGFVFGLRGGLLLGLLGGFILGPFMPINSDTGEMQDTLNWIYRTGFFTLVGLFSGGVSDSVRSYLRHLKWIARHDTDTQLPNRTALLDSLSRLPQEKQADNSFVLSLISLQNAMELKSAFGFEIIEELMRQSAQRYGSILQHRTQVYRIDAEQLGILIENRSAQNIDALLAQLIDGARQPFQFNGIPIHTDSRLGYVAFDRLAHAPSVYLQHAEAALISAHENGQDCIAYDPQISTIAKDNLSVLGNLIQAIRSGQLSMHYQPKICMRSGAIKSVEALMRWHHPERGNIPPAVFIPRAEQSTLINLVTEFALEQSMQQIVQWRDKGIHIPIAVNISPRNLLQPGFSDLILNLLQRYGVEGRLLELEVTEGALMTDMARTIVELHRLADAKITISIDDFGTGYSSLQYLHKLPISLIKIDQSFVRRLPEDKGALHIVEAAVTLTHKMGMQTIAEGVESEEIYRVLAGLGCDIAQGFAVSRPLPADEFAQWYEQHKGRFGQFDHFTHGTTGKAAASF
jgi:EAL domain-containing protein (putative c-di-GMP-specific phosphodiesterase class I)/GGDEF domain-containing protein